MPTIYTLHQNLGLIASKITPVCHNVDYRNQRPLLAFRRDLAFSDHVFATGNEGFNFLTCWSESQFNFGIYIIPFHLSLWISLMSTCTLMTLMLTMYLRSVQADGTVSAWSLFFSNLVGQSYNLGDQVGMRLVLRIGLGSWFLISVIFTRGKPINSLKNCEHG